MHDRRQWAELGRALGLSPAVVSEGSMLGWSFASFRREIGEPVTPDPKTTPWLHGTWKGTGVIVRVARLALAPLIVDFPTMLDRMMPSTREGLFTMVVAEITPPLFAGVRMATFGSYRFGPPVHEMLVRIPPPRLHRAFLSYAANVPRFQRLFDQHDPSDDFPEVLAAAAERLPITIQDGVVEVFLTGRVTDAGFVSGGLDVAAAIAKELSRRASALPEEPAVTKSKSAWAEVLASRGLQFDPAHWHGFGRVNGAPVEVLLEPTESFVRTTVRALFPAPLGAALDVAHVASSSFIGRLAPAPGVATGDVAFDASFSVGALDEARARAVLGEAVRGLLSQAIRGGAHLLMNDAEVLLAKEQCVAPRELGQLIDDALAIVAAVSGTRPAPPYR